MTNDVIYHDQARDKGDVNIHKYPAVVGSFTACYPNKQRSRYSDWLRAGRSGDRNPVGARFSASAQTGPGAHPASCTMGTGFFPGAKSGRGVTLTTHTLLVPWSRKSKAMPLLPLWAVRSVQSLSACTRVHFTLPFTPTNKTRNNML